MDQTFGDLRLVTSTSECILLDANWTIESPTCDPFGREYNYPSAWAQGFALLGIREDDTALVGVGLIVILLGALWLVSVMVLKRNCSVTSLALLTLASCSPPVMLLMERGNIDTLVFALVVLGVWLAPRAYGLPTAVSLAIASVLKLFPAGSSLLLLEPTKGRLSRVLVFVAALVLGLSAWFAEYVLVAQRTPQATGTSFGSSAIPSLAWSLMELPGGDLAPRLFGLGTYLLLLAAVLAWICRWPGGRVGKFIHETGNSLLLDRRALQFTLAGGGAILFAFLLGSNWDYRLVFAVLLLAGTLIAFPSSRGMQIATPSVLVVAMMWGSFSLPFLYETLFELFFFILMVGLGAILSNLVVKLLAPVRESDDQHPGRAERC